MTFGWILSLVEDMIRSDKEDSVYVLDLIPNLLWMQNDKTLLKKDISQELKEFEAKVI